MIAVEQLRISLVKNPLTTTAYLRPFVTDGSEIITKKLPKKVPQNRRPRLFTYFG